MKNNFVKELVEITGVISIVASLIFVGLQLKQSQQIALAQAQISNNTNRVETLNEINDYSVVWNKGNAQEPLVPSDEAVYLNLIDNLNDSVFFAAYSTLLIAGEDPAEELFSGKIVSPGMAEWAYFLFKNPGALDAFNELETESAEARTKLLNASSENLYQVAINNAVNQLKNDIRR